MELLRQPEIVGTPICTDCGAAMRWIQSMEAGGVNAHPLDGHSGKLIGPGAHRYLTTCVSAGVITKKEFPNV